MYSQPPFQMQIYHLGLWGPKYVWIVPGWYPAGWWLTVTRENHGCTAEQLDEMLIYHLFVSGVQVIDKLDDIDYHGLVSIDVFALSNIFTILDPI